MRTCSVIAVVVATLAAGEISRGRDQPVRDTVVGTWVLKSMKVDEKDQKQGREEQGLPKIGTLFKFQKTAPACMTTKNANTSSQTRTEN